MFSVVSGKQISRELRAPEVKATNGRMVKVIKSAISFRSIDYRSGHDCKLLAQWHSDEEIQALWLPRRSPESIPVVATVESVKTEGLAHSEFSPLHELVIERDGISVGHVCLYLNPPHRLSRGDKVAWPTIIIGDKMNRRQGIGTLVGAHLLKLARDAGATHVEAGVFEFNLPIRQLLEKHGFREIGRVRDFTWHAGKLWPDVRYEMAL